MPCFPTRPRWRAFVGAWLLGGALAASAQDLEAARKLFLTGRYAECARASEKVIKSSTLNVEWPLLLARSQMETGLYPEAVTTVSNALRRYNSLDLDLVAYGVYKSNGQSERAAEVLSELGRLARSRMRNNARAADLVAVGRAALILNVDPKLVLENFFDEAKRRDPNSREAFIASGELALDKGDYALAEKIFLAAMEKFREDPDVRFGLARAYASGDRAKMKDAMEDTLSINPNHVPCLLMVADQMVDAEDYTEADNLLSKALQVNPWHPEAWAYRSVLAHLRNDTNSEASARRTGLKYWAENPRVDYLAGWKLSQKYRFLEGSAAQRRALKFDPEYLPSKIQLAQDLLRLGEEAEGWRLAREVSQRDAYDVTAFNLVTLRETMARFQTTTNKDFILRMSPRETALYGDRALALLQKAHDRLGEKYGFQTVQPTVVEIFPEQKDFGVRTFGMPDNPGFLGVCFGHVVTANSPASQGEHPANWEAVLWHEFCHVITLGLTRNKMPRWVSEGISVYEEKQENPIWGQAMNPRYREMILGEDLTPVGKLSSAFITAKTPLHVQFAYFESELVIEYLVQNFGLDTVKRILGDLGDGVAINEAIARRAAPMVKIEKDFAAFARDKAINLAPGLDWEKPEEGPAVLRFMQGDRKSRKKSGPDSSAATNSFELHGILPATPETNRLAQSTNFASDSTRAGDLIKGESEGTNGPRERVSLPHSNLPNYWKLTQEAEDALAAKKFAEAKAPLNTLIKLFPAQTGSDNAYAMLAAAQRGLNETNQERETLVKLASLQNDANNAYLRLMELDEARQDWAGVAENAERFLAVDPLLPQPYRYLARASEELGRPAPAVRSYQRLLLLDPPDPAETHFRLAFQLRRLGDTRAAKRQVLEALEEAPRFRAAQRLLLELQDGPAASPASGVKSFGGEGKP